MISQQDSARIDDGLKTVRVVWFAMVFSVGIYVFLSFMMPVDKIKIIPSQELLDNIRLAAYALAPVLFLAARSIKKYTLNKAKAPSNTRPNSDGSKPHPVMAVYTNATIFPLAIVDLIAVAGIVLFLLGKNQQDCIILCGIAAAMMLYFLPKREEIEELAQRMQRVGKPAA